MMRDNQSTKLLAVAGSVIVVLLSVAGYLLAADRALLEKRDEAAAVALVQHDRDIASLKASLAEMKASQEEALRILRRLERHAAPAQKGNGQ